MTISCPAIPGTVVCTGRRNTVGLPYLSRSGPFTYAGIQDRLPVNFRKMSIEAESRGLAAPFTGITTAAAERDCSSNRRRPPSRWHPPPCSLKPAVLLAVHLLLASPDALRGYQVHRVDDVVLSPRLPEPAQVVVVQ